MNRGRLSDRIRDLERAIEADSASALGAHLVEALVLVRELEKHEPLDDENLESVYRLRSIIGRGLGRIEMENAALYRAYLGVEPSALEMPRTNAQRLLRAEEAAAELNISVKTLYKQADKLPFTMRTSGRRLKFSAEGIEAWKRTGARGAGDADDRASRPTANHSTSTTIDARHHFPQPSPDSHLASETVEGKSRRLLMAKEAALRLGISVKTLYRNADRLPFARRVSARCVRFSEEGIDRWQRERRNPT
jgi:predicted DNA-binding transcriptional regulator AlpA